LTAASRRCSTNWAFDLERLNADPRRGDVFDHRADPTRLVADAVGPIGFGVVGAACGDQCLPQLPQLAQRVIDLGDAVLEELSGPSARRLTAAVGGQNLRRRVQAQPQ